MIDIIWSYTVSLAGSDYHYSFIILYLIFNPSIRHLIVVKIIESSNHMPTLAINRSQRRPTIFDVVLKIIVFIFFCVHLHDFKHIFRYNTYIIAMMILEHGGSGLTM